MILGEKVILKEIEEDDLSLIVKWRNDPDILKFLFSYLPLNNTSQKKWYGKYLDDDSQQLFIIWVNNKKNPIGTVGLTSIDYKNQTSELSIIIGDKTQQNKGIGKIVLNLLIKFAFDNMNIRKIKAEVLEENTHAIRLYRTQGFIKEGILEKEVYKNGEFKNVIIMSRFK